MNHLTTAPGHYLMLKICMIKLHRKEKENIYIYISKIM